MRVSMVRGAGGGGSGGVQATARCSWGNVLGDPCKHAVAIDLHSSRYPMSTMHRSVTYIKFACRLRCGAPHGAHISKGCGNLFAG